MTDSELDNTYQSPFGIGQSEIKMESAKSNPKNNSRGIQFEKDRISQIIN